MLPRPGQTREGLSGWLSPLEVLSGREEFLCARACVGDTCKKKSLKSWRLRYPPSQLSQICPESEIREGDREFVS